VAYPGEAENAAYQQYVIDQNENGQPALPKDQWRQQQAPQPTQPDPEARMNVIRALMSR